MELEVVELSGDDGGGRSGGLSVGSNGGIVGMGEFDVETNVLESSVNGSEVGDDGGLKLLERLRYVGAWNCPGYMLRATAGGMTF